MKRLLFLSPLIVVFIFLLWRKPSNAIVRERPIQSFQLAAMPPNYIWHNGEWIRNGNRYIYHKGFWIKQPSNPYIGDCWKSTRAAENGFLTIGVNIK